MNVFIEINTIQSYDILTYRDSLYFIVYVWDFIVLTLHDILCNTPHKLSCFCLVSLLQPPIVSMLSSLKALLFSSHPV